MQAHKTKSNIIHFYPFHVDAKRIKSTEVQTLSAGHAIEHLAWTEDILLIATMLNNAQWFTL